jgi:hypothetical protein
MSSKLWRSTPRTRGTDAMRFLHIGDIHLGPNERNAARLSVLDQIIDAGTVLAVDGWLIPGDLNHGRMTISDRNALAQRLATMAAIAPVVICYGNHDLPGDLDIFGDLATTWPIYVVSQPIVLHCLTPRGYVAIFVLPYPSRAGLVAAGTPSDQIAEAARQALDFIFIDAGAQLRQWRAEGVPTLMIGHVNVGGSITSSGQPNIGREIELDPTLLERLGDVPILLNHIHRAQSFSTSTAYYAGSICRLDWGEIEEKRYLVLHIEGNAWRVESKPIDVAPMYHVEGTLTRDGFDWTCDDGGYAEQAGPGFFAGAEVRVRFRYAAADKAALNFDLVTAPFVGATRIETDPIAEHTRAVRAPEVQQAQSLTEKVEAFVRSAGLAWAPSVEAKLAALQAPDGAAFLTEVENSVTDTVPVDAEVQEVCQ